MVSETHTIRAQDFDGPLDLLSFLLEENETPIAFLPLTPVIEQYLELMADLDEVDMELASAFLLMAATLLEIKTQGWLPDSGEEGAREPSAWRELELKLLGYRRCRLIAEDLKRRHGLFGLAAFRLPLAPGEIGISEEVLQDPLDRGRFAQAVEALAARNLVRFQDLRHNVRYLLQRERVSVQAKMAEIEARLEVDGHFDFLLLYPPDTSRPVRIAAFLAVLELLRQKRITVRQEVPLASLFVSRAEAVHV